MTQRRARAFVLAFLPVFALVVALVLGPGAAASRAAESPARAPHIVIALADDLGWNDVGYHGSEIRTPSIDRLASEGVRLNQFYAAPTCTPSRAALLTGRYPFRYGLQTHVTRIWSTEGLPLDERLLSQALGEAGYTTALVGKWHLGHGQPEQLPTQRGFDHQYGPYVFAGYFDHLLGILPSWGPSLDWHRNDRALREEGYTTDLFAREAVSLIESQDPATPLFLYLAFTAPHAEVEAPADAIAEYAGIENPKRRVHAATVTLMDRAIGRVREALERRGMARDTLFLFMSDNGGLLREGASNRPLRGQKTQVYEGGVRVPAVAHWPGVLPQGVVAEAPQHLVDLYPTLLALAGASTEQPLPLDGRDVWKTWSEGAPSPHAEIVIKAEKSRGALRAGRWKVILQQRWKGLWDEVELYDLAEDPGESRDLSDDHPERVNDLVSRLDHYRAQAVPALHGPRRPFGYRCPPVLGEGPRPACTHVAIDWLYRLWDWLRCALLGGTGCSQAAAS